MMKRVALPILVALLAFLVYAGSHSPFSPRDGSVNHPGEVSTASLADGAVPAGGAAGDDGGEAAMALAAAAAAGTPAEPQRGSIRRNSSLYVELTRLGVTPQEVYGVARASKKVYDLRRVQPGQRFAVYTNAAGALDSLEFLVSREQHLIVRRTADAFAAQIEDVPFTISYHVTHGTITHSIFASLQAQGAETELAAALDEIFGWTIDFISDLRRGDSYAVLYERKSFEDGTSTLGDVLAAKVVNQGVAHHAFAFTPRGKSEGYYDLAGASLQKSLRRSPLKFTRVTSNFTGRRYHPVYKTYRPHYGVDYGAPRGTSVYATGDGAVLVAGRRSSNRGNGIYVKIKHNNTYTSYYLHLQRVAKGVRPGVRVQQGQLIGYVGSSGAANGTHVCYRITRNGSWVNPRRLKLPTKEPVPGAEMADFERTRDAFLARLSETLLAGLQNGTAPVEPPSSVRGGRERQTLF
jgi:murein DD-endopeptidase MepM/ murein hydrolase activator NlpD